MLHVPSRLSWDRVVSLNRYEQLLHNYIEARPEERRFWVGRVLELAQRGGRREAAALDLNSMLWEYFEERSRHESPFREIAISEGMERISMLNLSEYLLRIWAPPRPKGRKKSTSPD